MKISRGDVRTVKRFLLFPLVLGDEMRWLEWVFIVQEAVIRETGTVRGINREMRWIGVEFMLDEED